MHPAVARDAGEPVRAQLYWTKIYNSTGHPMFSDDRTQLMFDGDGGSQDLRDRRAGHSSPASGIPRLHEHRQRARRLHDLRRRQRRRRSMNSESPVLPEATAAVTRRPPASGDRPRHDRLHRRAGRPRRQQVLGTAGRRAGAGHATTSASRSSKAAATTVEDGTGAARPLRGRAPRRARPTRRSSEALPLLPSRTRCRARAHTALWPTPYDITPVFNEVISKMISGEYRGAGARRSRHGLTQDIDHQVPELLGIVPGALAAGHRPARSETEHGAEGQPPPRVFVALHER